MVRQYPPELDIEGKALEQDSHQTESHASTNEDRHGAYATDRRERDDRDFESEHPSRLDRQYHRDEDERRYQDDTHRSTYTSESHVSRFASNEPNDDVDYESLYNKQGNGHDNYPRRDDRLDDHSERSHSYARRSQSRPQSNEARTTDLFKQLSNQTNDQDMLFNALMLYARENSKDVYDQYSNHTDNKHRTDFNHDDDRY